MYQNKNLNYSQIKNFIKQLIKNFANKKDFDAVACEFTRNVNNANKKDKYEAVNNNCFNWLMQNALKTLADDSLIIKLIHEYAKHLYNVDWSNSDKVHAALKKDFKDWAR